MADGEKPYRVYRGGRGRSKTPVATQPPPRKTPKGSANGRSGYRGPRAPRPKRRGSRPRRIGLVLLGLVVLLVVWLALGFVALSRGVDAANADLPEAAKSALSKSDGIILTEPSFILLLGTDHASATSAGRTGLRNADSIMLVRTDPGRQRITYLSIPRDLRVEIPGFGFNRINAAYSFGGPRLMMRTIRRYTNLPVNHLAVVDFGRFEQLIDALGGVEVNVPAPVRTNRFDCPFKTPAACRSWGGWRFGKGRQTLDGRRALVYSRVRQNELNPGENDLTRAERQQQVLQAIASKLTSIGTLARLPSVGDDLLAPLATDLTPTEFLQLGWLKFRSPADRAVHCRLGGDPAVIDGQQVIQPTEENYAVVAMVRGTTAPQPPLPGSGPYGPGCVTGTRSLDAGTG